MLAIVVVAWITLSLPLGIIVGRICGAGSRMSGAEEDPMASDWNPAPRTPTPAVWTARLLDH